MISGISYKTKQFFMVVIKLSIISGAAYYIYNRLTQNTELNFIEFTAFLSKNESFSIKNIIFLLVLTSFNWIFEILKWQKLVAIIKPISFQDALEQSLGSLTASLMTPNRIGDYGAKAMYYTRNKRKQIVLLNLIGNMCQMGVTLVLGGLGFMLLNARYDLDINIYKLLGLILIILIIILLAVVLTRKQKFSIKGYGLKTIILFLSALPKNTIYTTIGLSITRYFVFSFQFYVLLQLCGVELSYFTAMSAITSMYLLASVIPSFAVFDVVIKTSAAVYLFGFLGVDELTILSVSTLMWLLNFMFPSLFGSYFVLNFNLPKSEE